MAIDKLALYNDALFLVGAERLVSDTEARETRFLLDRAWEFEAVKHCLRLAKPAFARATIKLENPQGLTTQGLNKRHRLPEDYVGLVEVFADEDLDQKVLRRNFQDDYVLTEIDTIWVRYVRDLSDQFGFWSSDFSRVVSAYLATQIAPRLAPDKVEMLAEGYKQALEASVALTEAEEPSAIPRRTLTTLTPEYLPIYNDALQIMGLPPMTTITDERADRVELDRALNANLVKDLLSDYAWNFSRVMRKIERTTRIEPEYGHRYVFEKPVDMLLFDGIWHDEYCRHPLKNYEDEGRKIFASVDPIYIKYVPDKYVGQPSAWPSHFRRYVAAKMAEQAAPAIPQITPDNRKRIPEELKDRMSTAENRDFRQSPPQRIHTGSWVRARMSGSRNDGRP